MPSDSIVRPLRGLIRWWVLHQPPNFIGVTHIKDLRRFGTLHRRQWYNHVTHAGRATEYSLSFALSSRNAARDIKNGLDWALAKILKDIVLVKANTNI